MLSAEHLNDQLTASFEQLAGIGIWQYWPDKQQISLSQHAATLLELPIDQQHYPLEQWAKALSPSPQQLIAQLQEQSKDTNHFHIELNVHHKKWLRLEAQPAPIPANNFVGIVRDITEQKIQEEELRQSEKRWRNLTQNTPDIIMHVDLDTRILFMNYTLPEYTFEQIANMSFYDFLPPDEQGTIARCIEHVKTTGETDSFTVCYPNPQGQIRYYENSVSAMKEEGQITSMIVSSRDITDRVLAESLNRKLSAALENITDTVIITDKDGIIEYTNTSYQHLTDSDEQQIRGLDILELYPESHDNSEFRQKFTQNKHRGQAFHAALCYPLQDGSVRHEQKSVTPLKDNEGATTHFVIIGTDISKHKQIEIALAQAKQLAEEASRAKSSFLANMSHEIRTPMTGTLGMLNLLLRTDLDAQQYDYATKAQISTHTLLGIINNILDFSKIESGKMELDLHSFNLQEVLRQLAAMLSSSLGNKPVELMLSCPPDLPHRLIGDEMRLRQVLLNLTANALKFTSQGEVILDIQRLTQQNQEITLQFAITDTGIGIPADRIEQIFEGFSQAEASTTRKYGGTGLGLAISAQIVKLMGGELTLSSEYGKGSRFQFSINLPISSAETTPVLNNPPLHVLLVDDRPKALAIIGNMLDALGWSHHQLNNGADVIIHLLQTDKPYDLVLMDSDMPGMNGIECRHLIRKMKTMKTLPIVLMMSAHAREQLNSNELESNSNLFDGYLIKPVTAITIRDIALPLARPEFKLSPHKESIYQRLSGLRLLVADDHELNQQIVAEMLRTEGAQITLCSNGQQAVDTLLHNHSNYDLVLMDVQMPGMDGYQATKTIKAQTQLRQLPVIGMTANVMPADKQACYDAGMIDHIGKPIDLSVMIKTIVKHCPPKAITTAVDNGHVQATAVQAAQTSEDNESFDNLIDKATALERLGGSTSLYQKIQRTFLSDSIKNLTEGKQFIQQKNWSDARTSIHTLKGSAGFIGANQLHTLASDSEKIIVALINGQQDSSALQQLIPALETCLNKVCHAIEADLSTDP